jgi:hypothetical protein
MSPQDPRRTRRQRDPRSTAQLAQQGFRRVAVSVDDTDDLTKATSTGLIAEKIASRLAEEFGCVIELGVTRHQLLLREDVPYTSHNSAMCFIAWVPRGVELPAMQSAAIEIITARRAESSDPGLCLWAVPEAGDAEYSAWSTVCEGLLAFGLRAKCDFIPKAEAYDLAEATPDLMLSEHGGTGDGVVGALAAVGLRLGGADGRFRGKWDVRAAGGERDRATVAELRAHLSALVTGDVGIVDVDSHPVTDDSVVMLDDAVKPVLHDGMLTLVLERVSPSEFRVCRKEDLGAIGDETGTWARYCRAFELDSDVDERSTRADRSCLSCLYRRWVASGFKCVRPGV